MAMHASGTKLGGFFDVLSMYLIDGFMVAYSARRLFGLSTLDFVLIFCNVLALCLAADREHGARWLYFGMGNLAFGFFILMTAVFESFTIFVRKPHHSPGWAFASLGAIALAFFIWNMSRTGNPWCVPDSP